MAFNVYSEYHNVLHTVSINACRYYHHHSGDRTGGSVEMLDYYVYSPSPEDELIQREEIEEKNTAIKRALQITRRYIKTAFTEVEIEFIRLILTTSDTPAKIAKSLNTDYHKLSKSIYRTFEITSKFLIKSFRECGYYCRDELDFLPRLAAYLVVRDNNRRWLAENAERRKAQKHEWYKKHYQKLSPEELTERRKAKLEARLSKLPPEEREKALKRIERNARYYQNRKVKKASTEIR